MVLLSFRKSNDDPTATGGNDNLFYEYNFLSISIAWVS